MFSAGRISSIGQVLPLFNSSEPIIVGSDYGDFVGGGGGWLVSRAALRLWAEVGPWPMAYDPWPMIHGPWLTAHGLWPMVYGQWPMRGPWPMAYDP